MHFIALSIPGCNLFSLLLIIQMLLLLSLLDVPFRSSLKYLQRLFAQPRVLLSTMRRSHPLSPLGDQEPIQRCV